jgi:hypothetical protein
MMTGLAGKKKSDETAKTTTKIAKPINPRLPIQSERRSRIGIIGK